MDGESGERGMTLQSAHETGLREARRAGSKRIQKVVELAETVMGGEKYAKRIAEYGGKVVQEKFNDIKDRVETRAIEIRDGFMERVDDARDRFASGYERARARTIAKATELGKRATMLGLTPVAKLEEVYANIYKLPAGLEDWLVSRRQPKLDEANRVAAEKMGLYRQQLRQLEGKQKAAPKEAELAIQAAKEARDAAIKAIEEGYKQQVALIEGKRDMVVAGLPFEKATLKKKYREELVPIKEARDLAAQEVEGHKSRARGIRSKVARMNKVRSALASVKASL
ncbi:MAG: hypothetical protein UV33_C0031G0005 [Candidatus Daviesbacteria bacterium GW2011_GWA1_42_6]|uniref:Uncharacterized protein n=1 Tax=Candidatus Daviesbacteria bacterium GW2011_GWA1_42_6 TaxID=1618420 RepID=A0A0G1D065_9BACT|nr:MAG: hypothetical protein UV33_C0031G0005 [Candidatus Daviesbacteria bacterium GW2011_GWA1_42_6]